MIYSFLTLFFCFRTTPHANELRTFCAPEARLCVLVKTMFGVDLVKVQELYYFVEQYGVLALRLDNHTIFQVRYN